MRIGDRWRKQSIRVMWSEKDSIYHCWLEDGRTKDFGQPLEAGKGRTGFSSRAYREECSHADPFMLAWGDPFQTSDLQSCQIIYLHCFELLSLWYSSNRKLIEESYVLARQKDKRKGPNLHFVYQALALICTKINFQRNRSHGLCSWGKKFTN